jgi:beta-lactamase superfamily II metal-dependent hydrolase
LLLQSRNGNKSTLVLIDGGTSQTYDKDLKPTINALPLKEKKFDLTILSHIDNDHILGLLDLFEEIKMERQTNAEEIVRIESLWHNSFSDMVGENTNDRLMIRNLFLSKQFSAAALDSNMNNLPVIAALKGVGEGRDLRKLAQSLHIPINPQFGGGLITAEDKSKIVKVGSIKFLILGPTQENLDRLRKVWNDWVRIHLKSTTKIDDIRALQALDASIANLSSIMFIVEAQTKKILFTGDGLGNDVIDILSKTGLLDAQRSYHVDLMKVPHHGSERNTSKDFFDSVTADAYVISANGRDDNPSTKTLQWIIESKRSKDKVIKIYLTNRTENTDKILQQYDQKKFQYRFHFLEKESHSLKIPLN